MAKTEKASALKAVVTCMVEQRSARPTEELPEWYGCGEPPARAMSRHDYARLVQDAVRANKEGWTVAQFVCHLGWALGCLETKDVQSDCFKAGMPVEDLQRSRPW